MARKIKSPEIEYLSQFKWRSPNKFNGVDAVLALIITVASLNVFGNILAPVFVLLRKIGLSAGQLLCLSALLTQGLIFVLALIFFKIKGIRIFSGNKLDFKFDISSCIPAILLVIGTFLFLSPTHMAFVEDMDYFQRAVTGHSSLDSLNLTFGVDDYVYVIMFSLVLSPVLPAICEELMFRGVVMNGLREFGSVFAIIASGMLFAFMHGTYAQIILQFVLGCEIALVVILTGNFFVGCAMHFANNLFVYFYNVVFNVFLNVSNSAGMFFEAFSIIVGLVAVIFSIIYYFKLYNFKKYNKFVTNNKKSHFMFYKDIKKRDGYCCLLQKGLDVSMFFSASENSVLNCDNSEMLFFYNGKFRKFTNKSDKILFIILFICSVVLTVGLIIYEFI